MKQSSFWGSNRSSTSQEILRNLWNLEVHYRAHNSRLRASIRSQIDLVHNPLTHFINIYFNIILIGTF